MEKINIAIDGYSSCGKSTLAKKLARKLHYGYVDTGAMYRAVTLFLLNRGLIKDGIIDRDMIVPSLNKINIEFKHNTETSKSETYLNGVNVEKDIRTPEISKIVSSVSRIKEIREKLALIQMNMGEGKGVVMDGRDIGTHILPNAELKLFMISDLDIRVQRRYDEMIAKGFKTTKSEVKENLLQRDHEDSNRIENPLTQAPDAIVLDNTNLTLEELLAETIQLVNQTIGVEN